MMKNYFEFFQMPQKFSLDGAALELVYRQVQSKVHPDKFSQTSDIEQRVAMQWSTYANEAYQILKNPLKRAQYLCTLNAIEIDAESSAQLPIEFLMQQIEWRELLGQAIESGDQGQLKELKIQVHKNIQECTNHFAEQYASGDFSRLAQEVRQWMFVQKFYEELMSTLANLES